VNSKDFTIAHKICDADIRFRGSLGVVANGLEGFKEYELILVYAYMQARTKNSLHFNVFQDLVDESHFHLKSFGNMMAKLGILGLPRELHEMTYIVKDLNKFVVRWHSRRRSCKGYV